MNILRDTSKDLGKLLECSVCLGKLNNPKILPCSHSYCKKCLYQLIQNSKTVDCPLCKRNFQVPINGFPTDFKSNQLLDFLKKPQHEQNISYTQGSSTISYITPSAPPLENEPMLKKEQEQNNPVLIRPNEKLRLKKYLIIFLILVLIISLIFILILYSRENMTCDSSKYRNGKNCIDKKHYLEPCENSNQCSDKQLLHCINGTCSCFQKFTFYGFEQKKCLNKKQQNDDCYMSLECLEPMTCQKRTCQCNRYEFFDEINMKCLNRTLVNSSCQSNQTCHGDLGLTCQNYLCQCDLKNKFWSSKQNKCVDLYKYGSIGCTSDQHCHGNLICNSYWLENNCSCPLRSVPGMCDCQRTEGNEFFWNGSFCEPAGNKMSACKKDYQCLSSLECLDRLSLCSSKSILGAFLKSDSNRPSFVEFNLLLSVVSFIMFKIY